MTTRLPPGNRETALESALDRIPRTDEDEAAELAWMKQTALLDSTLTRIIRYAQLMKTDLRAGKLDNDYAEQIGRSSLTALREAVAISADAERAAKSAA